MLENKCNSLRLYKNVLLKELFLQKMKASEPKEQQPRKSDLELWEELKNGSVSALGSLYNVHIDDLFRHGIQYAKSRAYVMDCIHDLFLDLYKYRTKLANTDNVKYYLLSALKRKINKERTRKVLPLQTDFLSDPIEIKNTTASIEEEIIRNERTVERSTKLTNALELLTRKQRTSLFLRFTQNKSYEEIAHIMKTSIPTARTSIYRAIKVLRERPLLSLILSYLPLFP